MSAVHGGGKSCEERESLWAFLACLYVAAVERRRRGRRGREAVVGRGEFEQGAVGCRERQKRAERVSGGSRVKR